MIKFSFLVPTRNRADLVARLFESIVDTTSNLNELEVILCIDEDDIASREITHHCLSCRKVVVAKGHTMGELNRACFDASQGRFVMLMNDDVILRTKGWDLIVSSVFDSFPDEIALVHVNDLLFRENLCTFPILSRKACEKIGICPEGYQRYRIDDHIYDIYNMLAYLGHKRIVYLENVIFEHDNFAHDKGQSEHFFKSMDNRIYLPNVQILERDAFLFDQLLVARKQDVLALANIIDSNGCSRNQKIYASQLDTVKDSSYRSEDLVKKISGEKSKLNKNSITIAVVTSDLRRSHARKCLSLLKKHTSDFDLVVLDNNCSKDFNHPREMNKILQYVNTDFLVLMDDDVYVEPCWLEGLIECIDAETGIVTPLHRDRSGRISYAGVYLKGDGTGSHAHILDIPGESRPVPCICSAVILIDMKKCGSIRFDTAFRKYFLDLDYSLQVWESGFKVVCSSRSIVTHLGGATMSFSSAKGHLLWKRDEAIFIETWIHSGRLSSIEQQVWSSVPFIHDILNVQKHCEEVFSSAKAECSDFAEFAEEVGRLLNTISPLHLFHQKFESHLRQYIRLCEASGFSQGVDFSRGIILKLSNLSAAGRFFSSLVEKCLFAPLGVLKSSGRMRSLATFAAEILKRTFDRYRSLPDPVRSLLDPLVFRIIKYYERAIDFMSQAPDAGADSEAVASAEATGGILYLSLDSVAGTKDALADLNPENLTLLLPKSMKNSFPSYRSLLCRDMVGRESETFDLNRMSPAVLGQIRSRYFETMIIQYGERVNWGDIFAEKLVESFRTKFMLLFPDGRRKMYERDDDLNRLIYNKVYLGSMLKFVPPLAGHSILDVGCSDGMVCDLLLNEKPAAVTGIDIMGDVGSNYTDSRISYHQMNALDMSFENETFDLTFSIATLEHCSDPLRVLYEMKRVTRKGGYCYIQAGPLYYSPFGHHMFGYFDDFPWIHLCMSQDQIIKYCKENRLDAKIKRCTGKDVEEYIASMLDIKHVNMKKIHEYGIQEFINTGGIELLHFAESYEGSSFLADGIRDELKPYSRDDLTAHGFELIFQIC